VKEQDETLRTAGRGGVAVLGAKVFFIVIGFVQQPLLRASIGLAGYGALSRVLSVANIVNNVVVSSSTQGVSRAVSRAPGHERQALRATLRVHAPLAVGLALAFAALAPLVAWFQHAPHITWPLVVLSGVVLLYGLYAPLIGALNGQRQFTRQAALDVCFAVLRTTGLVGMGALFVSRGLPGPLGATLGFVVAAGCILPVALRWTGLGQAGETELVGKVYLAQLLPIAGAQLFTNLLMQSDMTLLGRFLSLGAVAAGLGDGARTSADEWVGVYRACQLFAFLPYQLLFSVTQVLFPMLARARAENDWDAVRRYVARGARIGAILCGLLVCVVVALAESLLAFAYGADVGELGAAALRVLALGQGAFAMMALGTTVLTSLGRERTSAVLTLGAVVAVVALCWLGVADAPFGASQLVRTALATSGALAVALGVAGVLVYRQTRAFVPLRTALRVGAAVLVCVGVGLVLPRVGRFATMGLAGGVAALYVAFLTLTGELGKEDLAVARAVLGRKGG
jgi:stage V sporulation protein B